MTVSFVNPGFTCFPAELGDYDDVQHSSGYVSEFRFVAAQSEEMENDVEYAHASMAGLTTNSIFLLGFCKKSLIGLGANNLNPSSGTIFRVVFSFLRT